MRTLRSGLKAVIAALFTVLCAMEAAATESVPGNMTERPPRILLLSSVNLSFVQYFQEVTSFLNTLNQANSSYLVEHYTPESPQTLSSPEKFAEIRELLDKKLWNIPDRIKDKGQFEEKLNQSIRQYNPEYWRARQSGREAVEAARSTAPAKEAAR